MPIPFDRPEGFNPKKLSKTFWKSHIQAHNMSDLLGPTARTEGGHGVLPWGPYLVSSTPPAASTPHLPPLRGWHWAQGRVAGRSSALCSPFPLPHKGGSRWEPGEFYLQPPHSHKQGIWTAGWTRPGCEALGDARLLSLSDTISSHCLCPSTRPVESICLWKQRDPGWVFLDRAFVGQEWLPTRVPLLSTIQILFSIYLL